MGYGITLTDRLGADMYNMNIDNDWDFGITLTEDVVISAEIERIQASIDLESDKQPVFFYKKIRISKSKTFYTKNNA